MLKRGWGVPDNVPSKEKRYVGMKNLQKVRKLKKRGNLKLGHFLFNRRWFIWIVSRFPTIQVAMHESLKTTSKPSCPSP
jgi:hypothetical protein